MSDETNPSIFEAFYRAAAKEIAELEYRREQVRFAKTVQDAEGATLDKFASIFQLQRQTGESDAEFRIRIIAFFISLTGAGTLSDLREQATVLLDSDGEAVSLTEPEAATNVVRLSVLEATLDEAGLSLASFVNALERSTAGGVIIEALAEGKFAFAAGTSPIDESVADGLLGYAALDGDYADGESTREDIRQDIGGTWSSAIRTN